MVRAWAFGGGPAFDEVSAQSNSAVTAVDGVTFCISDRNGDIRPDGGQGLFFQDTRFISGWHLRIDGQPVAPLAVLRPGPYAAKFITRRTPPTGVADSTLLVVRERDVSAGMVEKITIRNLSASPVDVETVLDVEADFAGLFEVKEGRVRRRRRAARSVAGPWLTLTTPDGKRRRAVRVTDGEGSAITADRLQWQLAIPPRGEAVLRVLVQPELEGIPVPQRLRLDAPIESNEPALDLAAWRRRLPRVKTTDPSLFHLLGTSLEDLGALRITDAHQPPRSVVAAGTPWFMTLFGRDSLLTSWMLLPIDLSLVAGTLHVLADLQGRAVNPTTEEQPGRILHEVRSGLDAESALGGRSVYYGTIDSTPLFVMLVEQAHRWGLPDDDVRSLLDAVDRAIDWIEHFGDRDGDGYVEYQRATDRGLVNQGWKDSFDAINHPDGTLAEPPIALAEVQGYVYAAYRARARLAEYFGDHEAAARLTERAAVLRRRFNEDFWLPEHGYHALALDRDKRPVESLASNLGHCLWTGIADPAKAESVALRLTAPEMFTGFGIRTLANTMGAYNPVSYHNGSVWPHDTAIAVAGLMRYGFVAQAQQVSLGLLDAAARLGGRLPELICGFDRSEFEDPVPYPTSCSPQAWAAGAPLLVLRSLLRFQPDLPRRVITCQPALPAELMPLRIDGVAVGPAALSLNARRAGWQLGGVPDGVRLQRRAAAPG